MKNTCRDIEKYVFYMVMKLNQQRTLLNIFTLKSPKSIKHDGMEQLKSDQRIGQQNMLTIIPKFYCGMNQ